MFAFFVYSIFFLFLVYLHFHFAWMALRRMRGSTSHEIDTSYVKIEDYIGQSLHEIVGKFESPIVTAGAK